MVHSIPSSFDFNVLIIRSLVKSIKRGVSHYAVFYSLLNFLPPRFKFCPQYVVKESVK